MFPGKHPRVILIFQALTWIFVVSHCRFVRRVWHPSPDLKILKRFCCFTLDYRQKKQSAKNTHLCMTFSTLSTFKMAQPQLIWVDEIPPWQSIISQRDRSREFLDCQGKKVAGLQNTKVSGFEMQPTSVCLSWHSPPPLRPRVFKSNKKRTKQSQFNVFSSQNGIHPKKSPFKENSNNRTHRTWNVWFLQFRDLLSSMHNLQPTNLPA